MRRSVLITGASSGIGKAMAYAFAENGDLPILTGRRLEKLKEIQSDLKRQFEIEAPIYQLDVTDFEQVKAVTEELENVDILINNAGLALGLDKFQEYELSDMVTMLDTNIKGLIYMTRQLLPQMIENNRGHIINIGSTAGIYAYAGAAVYSATKAAVKVLSDGIRIDTIDSDVKVTTVQPGIVQTDFSQVRFHGDKQKADRFYQGIEALKPEDIAEIVCFIANQPRRIQISDITIMANQQATGFTIHRQ
ncbi:MULTISPECIES: SDR family NAD(P)-dependent oxidoreductase [Streptococcus]|uniref:NADP-dependent 3-hydroxy acid dehydrogenase YdfG n=1 Tax=Streptococcus porcorum TaxID=701526 RepID=A0ABV2JCV3_9STRE|nr:SDR family NAD(P)-dependent oxidoreductase [Streptococcus sp.]